MELDPKPRTKRRSRKADLARWIAEHQPARIGEAEYQALLAEFAPISSGYLRRLLRDSGVPLSPLVEGVRQETLDALETSLRALLADYEHSAPDRQRAIRRVVIEAKDHARWSARKNPEKEEMLLWLLTWLENPPLFPSWVELRRQADSPAPH